MQLEKSSPFKQSSRPNLVGTRPNNVRCGSSADIAAALPNVRFTRESGHQRKPASCPL